jgi:hypothetical protein
VYNHAIGKADTICKVLAKDAYNWIKPLADGYQ